MIFVVNLKVYFFINVINWCGSLIESKNIEMVKNLVIFVILLLWVCLFIYFWLNVLNEGEIGIKWLKNRMVSIKMKKWRRLEFN